MEIRAVFFGVFFVVAILAFGLYLVLKKSHIRSFKRNEAIGLFLLMVIVVSVAVGILYAPSLV